MKDCFRVDEPFRIYAKRGWCWTNAWVGQSRVGASVYDAVNARPGDEIHCLPGGTFLVRADGTAVEIRLTPPKHIFEKTYLHRTVEEILERSGRASRIGSPSLALDAAAIRSVADVQFPDYSAEVRHVEDSPELARLKEASSLAIGAVQVACDADARDGRGESPSITAWDHGESPVVRLGAFCGEYREFMGRTEAVPSYVLEHAFIPDFATLTVPEDEAVPGHEPEKVAAGRAHYRMTLGEAAGWFGRLLSHRLAEMEPKGDSPRP